MNSSVRSLLSTIVNANTNHLHLPLKYSKFYYL